MVLSRLALCLLLSVVLCCVVLSCLVLSSCVCFQMYLLILNANAVMTLILGPNEDLLSTLVCLVPRAEKEGRRDHDRKRQG